VLYQEVKNLTFVVDCPPQPVFPATDLDDHLIKMPASTGTQTASAKITGDRPPELQKPAPYCLVRHVDVTHGQQVFDVAI